MPKVKVIRIETPSIYAFATHHEAFYEDFGLSYHDGRRRVYFYTLINSRSRLLHEIESKQRIQRDYKDPEYVRNRRIELERDYNVKVDDSYFDDIDYSDNIAVFEGLLAEVDREGYTTFNEDSGYELTDIFTHFHLMNRKNIELALTWYLKKYFHLTAPLKFSWVKYDCMRPSQAL